MEESERPDVGQVAERSRRVTEADIEAFTAISGDRNPLHHDPAAAADSRFGAVIVQGGVITAILNAVVAEDLPGPGSVFLHVDWSFRAPVFPGDTITGNVEVTNGREDKPITALTTTVMNRPVTSFSRAPPSPGQNRSPARDAGLARNSISQCRILSGTLNTEREAP